MSNKQEIPIRDARDRLIDLLGFGETYPLQDLMILDDQLTVPFEVSAKIPIEDSQLDVAYQLYDRDDVPVRPTPSDPPIEEQGSGGILILESPKISDDVTYKVRALKNISGRKAYLHETATIKVGLDVSLSALIVNTPFLEPALDNLKESDARIVDYGTAVNVKLKKSQEGVDYRLVSLKGTKETVLSEPDVRGTLDDIVLSAKALYEDTDMRIRATKTFDPSEGRETQTALLDIVLPLKIRANTALDLTIDPMAIIGYKKGTALKITGTQTSVRYRLYVQKVSDADFVFGEASGKTVLTVTRSDSEKVQVLAPSPQPLWSVPERFEAHGPQKTGTGSDVSLSLTDLSDDTLVIVQAEKRHQGQNLVPSAVQLSKTALVLVRPNPEPALHLRVTARDPNAVGPIEVLGGQPGVFYHLRKTPSGSDLALPAYFHKRDESRATQNKGINQIRIGVDFVVPRTLPAEARTAETDPAKIFPASSVLEMDSLALGGSLQILAVKAQTQISNPVLKSADIPKLPQIAFENAQVDKGKAAKLVVSASQVGEKYQLYLEGMSVRKARNGNGNNLVFTTDAIAKETIFEMRVTQPGNANLQVERILLLKVSLRPGS